ncbi:hypothetical protein ACX80Z_15865 [Arthrobacter sp. TMT4-20]
MRGKVEAYNHCRRELLRILGNFDQAVADTKAETPDLRKAADALAAEWTERNTAMRQKVLESHGSRGWMTLRSNVNSYIYCRHELLNALE